MNLVRDLRDSLIGKLLAVVLISLGLGLAVSACGSSSDWRSVWSSAATRSSKPRSCKAASVRAAALYSTFKSWCSDTGANVVRMNDFSAELQARGFERKRDSRGAAYHGIGLHALEDEE